MLSRATMHLSCPKETAPFMAQDGCAFIHTKTTILLTSGPGMTRKTQCMNDVHGIVFSFTVQIQTQVFCCIAWTGRGWPHSMARNAPAADILFKDNHAHNTSILMSYLHPHGFYTTLESCIPFQRNRHAITHGNCVCYGELRPPHHLSKSGQHWPLSASLSQHALSYETRKLVCIRFVWLHLCMCVFS